MKVERIVLGTSNQGKVKEWGKYLSPITTIPAAEIKDLEDPEETGKTFRENARLKAIYYALELGEYVLSEDGGFEIDHLDGAPGVKSRRILPGEKEGSDEDLVSFVMEKLEGVPDKKRGARLVVHACLADPEGNVIFEDKGAIEGVVPKAAHGYIEPGYPYRSVLYVFDAEKVYVDFDEEDHERLNHKAPIAERLKTFLLEYKEND